MTPTDIFLPSLQALATALVGVLWWNFRTLKMEVKDAAIERERLNADLQAYKLHVAETYVKNQDLDRLEGKIDRLFDKLDTKVDK